MLKYLSKTGKIDLQYVKDKGFVDANWASHVLD